MFARENRCVGESSSRDLGARRRGRLRRRRSRLVAPRIGTGSGKATFPSVSYRHCSGETLALCTRRRLRGDDRRAVPAEHHNLDCPGIVFDHVIVAAE